MSKGAYYLVQIIIAILAEYVVWVDEVIWTVMLSVCDWYTSYISEKAIHYFCFPGVENKIKISVRTDSLKVQGDLFSHFAW